MLEVSLKERFYLPHFIIGGGMKCGTTTLHWILNQHKQIFIPPSIDEPHFFSIDDIEQNPDFFLKTSQGWFCLDFDKHFEEYLQWYLSFFEDAHKNQFIGEDCVSYLSSTKAPARIASILPDVRLIFMLRDPVARTYSQYWHWVKTNRAIYNFENTLQFSPGHLIQRSLYRQHVERFLKYFPRKQIKFIIFESFINNVQNTVNEICEFLELDTNIDIRSLNTHVNKALVPRSIKIQLLFNNFFKTKISGRKYQSYHLPNADINNHPRFLSWISKMFHQLNLTPEKQYPPMNPETRKFLECLFAKENRGLSELVEIPLDKFWPYMRES